MTACESSGYTGASFSITTVFQIRHIIHRFLGGARGGAVVAGSNLINNILFLADCQNNFLSPSTDAGACLLACFFGGFDQTPQKAPSPSVFSL